MMAKEYHLPPSASSLSTSLRDIGYSLETAISDLVDNSIAASASEIEIFCDLTGDKPVCAIIDNGRGMDNNEIIQAMKHGSINPRMERLSDDLGRFGLGLKTASFSQCRQLIVASAKNGIRCCASWDLDLIDEKDEWIISILDEEEIQRLPYINHIGRNGTIVIWSKLDRLFENAVGHKRDEIVNDKLDQVEKHLSLVFHRFLSGEVKSKVNISINGHKVEPFDPFCRSNTATQILPSEVVHIDEAPVSIQPFILPHHSKLSSKEYNYYQSHSDFISNQGAYIYRNGRLMAWGGWFRIKPKNESTKLARVQIDFPSKIDSHWTIDIKKSSTIPPTIVRERLRQIISDIIGRSTRIYKGRGQRLFDKIDDPVWERYAEHGYVNYQINKSHPLIKILSDSLKSEQNHKLNLLIDAINSAVPLEMIYADYASHPQNMQQATLDKSDILDKLYQLKLILSDSLEDSENFRSIVRSTRSFENYMDVVEEFIEKEF